MRAGSRDGGYCYLREGPGMSIANLAGVGGSATAPKARQTSDTSSLDRRIEQLQKQLEQIKRNEKLPQEEKEKRIAHIEKQIARLKQQKSKESSEASPIDREKRVDTYEAQPPRQPAGVYKVTHDEAGQRKIWAEKNWGAAQGQSETDPANEGEKPAIVKTAGNTDKVDRGTEKLEQAKAQLERKMAAAKEPKDKESLEAQLAQVKAARK